MRKNIYWSLLLILLGLVYCILNQSSFYESSVLLSGIACVSLIAVGVKEAYIIGLYSSIAYAEIAFQNGLYGEVGLNILFYVPTGILGYFMWQKHSENGQVQMQRLSSQNRILLILVSLVSILILGALLRLIPSQNSPFMDASTNILSIFATFLMMWRYAEQWILYIALNLLTIVMWVIRWHSEGYAGDTMIFMWSIYLVNSIFGLILWTQKSELKLSKS